MKDNIYEQACAQVREYVEKNGSTRKERFRIIRDLTGVDENTARIVDRYARAVREVIPPDAKCKEMERGWQRGSYIHQWEYENLKKEKQSQLI